MGVHAERSGDRFFQLFLDRQWGLARRQANTVADAEDVRIDSKGFGSEGTVHHDIGGLAAHAGQTHQLIARLGDFAVKLIQNHL